MKKPGGSPIRYWHIRRMGMGKVIKPGRMFSVLTLLGVH